MPCARSMQSRRNLRDSRSGDRSNCWTTTSRSEPDWVLYTEGRWHGFGDRPLASICPIPIRLRRSPLGQRGRQGGGMGQPYRYRRVLHGRIRDLWRQRPASIPSTACLLSASPRVVGQPWTRGFSRSKTTTTTTVPCGRPCPQLPRSALCDH